MTKTIFSFAGLLALLILFSSAISIEELPQDPPRVKKAEKHIKMVKVDDEGNKTEIDTVLKGDQVFVWNGDTIGGGKGMNWITKGGEFDFDGDMDFDFDFDIDTDKSGKVLVMKSGKALAPMVYRFKTEEGDSTKEYRVKIIAKGDNEDDLFFDAPHAAHKMMVIGDRKKGNVIDLSDPGIISFQKKDLKDGKEKITIVREKPSEEKAEMNKKVIIHNPGDPMTIHGSHPKIEKRIKVIAGDDGKVEILEDGEVLDIEKMEEGEKVIERDGKKIIIKKIKEGDEMKVNVEVEEKIEEK